MVNEPHLLFPPFRLDPINAQLWRGDQEIHLRRKTFDVLRYLAEHSGELVTKTALLDAVWAGVFVSESMAATCIAELRKILGDEARTPRFIETVHGRGYRFIAKVMTAVQEVDLESPLVAMASAPIMVGRASDLAQLQDWYSEVLQGQRRIIFVVGEAGIGKTTIVQAFLNSIAQRGSAHFGHGQCVEQYGAGEPYMPVLEALSRLGQEPGGARVIELLNRFAPTWLAQMPALLTPEERARTQVQSPVTQQRMLREMTDALEALAADAPLVLWLEDLHGSDFSTLELISAVARRAEPARLLLVGSYRLVEALANEHPLRTMRQELGLHRYCEELALRLLNETDVAGYLARRFPSDGSQRFDSLAAAIHKRADGSPLFMVSAVDYLVDTGLLPSSGQAYAAIAALQSDSLDAPRSIREMIERNLERLKPEEQAVLEGASVAGVEFSAAAVAAALERPQAEVESCCMRLARHQQFVTEQEPVEWPDGTVAARFRFHHKLYQEVLYGLLSPSHRVRLHRLIASREETAYGGRGYEVASELAHHYSRANDRRKAIQYFRVAGERAEQRGAAAEAERDYRHAVELMKELPESAARDHDELGIQIALGTVLRSSRSWSHPETEHTFARAEELAKKLGETGQLVSVLMG
jgi:predicted ATPase